MCFFFFKQKTAYELRISDWSSDVCSSDLHAMLRPERRKPMQAVTEGDRRKEVRVLLDQIQAHPERDWTKARRRLATLNKLIAKPSRPRRSEKRRVRKGCVRTCRPRWSPQP